jgi:hypothetical protein
MTLDRVAERWAFDLYRRSRNAGDLPWEHVAELFEAAKPEILTSLAREIEWWLEGQVNGVPLEVCTHEYLLWLAGQLRAPVLEERLLDANVVIAPELSKCFCARCNTVWNRRS